MNCIDLARLLTNRAVTLRAHGQASVVRRIMAHRPHLAHAAGKHLVPRLTQCGELPGPLRAFQLARAAALATALSGGGPAAPALPLAPAASTPVSFARSAAADPAIPAGYLTTDPAAPTPMSFGMPLLGSGPYADTRPTDPGDPADPSISGVGLGVPAPGSTALLAGAATLLVLRLRRPTRRRAVR